MWLYRSEDSETAGQSSAFLRCSLASWMTAWCVVASYPSLSAIVESASKSRRSCSSGVV